MEELQAKVAELQTEVAELRAQLATCVCKCRNGKFSSETSSVTSVSSQESFSLEGEMTNPEAFQDSEPGKKKGWVE